MGDTRLLPQLVSVIIPTLNEKPWIRGLLNNICAQAYRPIEVLIVDGGSTDGTIPRVEEISKQLSDEDFQVRLLLESDFGSLRSSGNARSIGVLASKASKILFLDPDMRFLREDDLANLAAELETHSFALVKTRILVETDFERSLARVYSSFHHCGYRREIFEKVNFNRHLGYGEDKDFWYRAQRELGLDLKHVCDVTIGRHLPHTKKEYLRQTLWYAKTMPAFIANAAEEGEEEYLEEAGGWLMYWAYSILLAGLIPLAVKDTISKKGVVESTLSFMLWDYLARRLSSAFQFFLSALKQRRLAIPTMILVWSLRKRFLNVAAGRLAPTR